MLEPSSLEADPFYALRRLEGRTRRLGIACLVGALTIHGGLFEGAVLSRILRHGVSDAHAQERPMTVELEADPPPPSPVVPEVTAEPVQVPAASTAPKLVPQAIAIPAAARAGKALVAEPDDETPTEDDNTIATAENETYAGGDTDREGTNGQATHGGKGAGSAPIAAPGPPVAAPPPPRDLSRPAKCSLDVDWGCEAPDYAKDDKIVIVQLAILESGRVDDVRVLASPGTDYAREATKCSRTQKCVPAWDRNGVAIRGETNPIRLRFTH
jgi:hypothetical protein